MDVREYVKQRLETVLKTYHLDIPDSNETFPCCVFWVSERPKTNGDDGDIGREITVNVEGFIDVDDDFDIFERIIDAMNEENDEFFVRLIDKGDILGIQKTGVSFIFEISKI